MCPQFTPCFCILPWDPVGFFHALFPIKNPRHPAISLRRSKPKNVLRNWIFWADCTIFDPTPKDGRPLLRSSVNLGSARRQKAPQKDACVVGRRRLQRRQGQSKSKLGSREQTQAVGTQRGKRWMFVILIRLAAQQLFIICPREKKKRQIRLNTSRGRTVGWKIFLL